MLRWISDGFYFFLHLCSNKSPAHPLKLPSCKLVCGSIREVLANPVQPNPTTHCRCFDAKARIFLFLSQPQKLPQMFSSWKLSQKFRWNQIMPFLENGVFSTSNVGVELQICVTIHFNRKLRKSLVFYVFLDEFINCVVANRCHCFSSCVNCWSRFSPIFTK